jgi:phosphoglucosamine mutase
VVPINDHPDGANINLHCGATQPDVVAGAVMDAGADAGVAFDGDADRAMFADAWGAVVDGDQVLAACAVAMHAADDLPGDTVVTTVLANLGFHRRMREAGIKVLTTKVGDRYVLGEMIRTGAVLGGEQSGHIIFRDHATTGDGLLTAVRFLGLCASAGRSVAEVAAMPRFPQVQENVPVANRESLDDAEGLWEAVRAAERALGDGGRVVVRASGTEPVVRVMVEAETEEEAARHAREIAREVQVHLG